MNNIGKYLITIFQILKDRDSSHKCYDDILEICHNVCKLKNIRLYFVENSTSNTIQLAAFPKEEGANNKKIYLLDTLKANSENIFPIKSTSDANIGWISSNRKCIDFEEEQSVFMTLLCEVLSREFEKVWLNSLFNEIIKPVDINHPSKKYYKELATVVGKASGMQFAAIRKYNEEEQFMECLSVYSKNDAEPDIDLEELVLRKGQPSFEKFKSVMFMKTPHYCTVINDESDEIIRSINSFNLFRNVRTVVIAPLLVGGKNLGTVSFGINHKTNFSKICLRGLSGIANNIGSALSNYEETSIVKELYANTFTSLQAVMNEELLQGLRHSAKNSLHDLYGKLVLLRLKLKNKKFNELHETLEDAISEQKFAMEAINDQAEIGNKSEPLFKEIIIKKIFLEATHLLQHKLSVNSIDVKISGAESAEAYLDENSTKYAFINLILNSIDSLKSKPKNIRKISFNIESAAGRCLVKFSDNGLGFQANPSKKITSINDIWEPGRTTKKEGTGYGLTYVRHAFQDINKGSIDVSDYRNGMTFKITLRKKQNSNK